MERDNFEPGAEEALKMLFGGDAPNVKVKYKVDASVHLTGENSNNSFIQRKYNKI
jgi:hypothetical protein